MSLSKTQLRTHLRKLRQSLSPAARVAASVEFARQHYQPTWCHDLHDIAAYLPSDGELDLRPWMRHLANWPIQWWLPVVRCKPTPNLQFAPFTAASKLVPNGYQILEPACDAAHYRTAMDLDLVLVPLVACDTRGHRLGRGGGYYDRLLAERAAIAGKVPFFGIGYDFQLIDQVPTDEWDYPVDGLLTEQRLIQARRVAGDDDAEA